MEIIDELESVRGGVYAGAVGYFGADGSVFNKYPHFKARGALALREILDWPKGKKDPISLHSAEDGSGVGAALIAALTIKRMRKTTNNSFATVAARPARAKKPM